MELRIIKKTKMFNNNKKYVTGKYQNLPKELQDAVFSVETAEKLQKIGKNAGLMIDETGILADETGLVMLGITPPSKYISNLEKRLGINREKAKKIASEVNQQIFYPVREALKKVHGLTEKPKGLEEKSEKETVKKPEVLEKKTEPEKAIKTEKKEIEISRKPARPENAKKLEGKETDVLQKPLKTEAPIIEPKNEIEIKKDIFEEKTKNEPFHSKPKVVEKGEENQSHPYNPKYPGGIDPYREPIE
jgi:hypothetical protein